MIRLPSPAARRRAAAACAGMLMLATAGCVIPTDAPILDQRWNVPAQSTTIGVAELLPAGVSIADGAFRIDVAAPAPVTRALYQDCPACQAANGMTIPKPAFTAAASTTTSVPGDIASATLTGGSLSIAIRNGYNFDPIRPAAGVFGTLAIRVTNGGTTLGTTTVSGATRSMAPGSTLSIDVPLSGAISGTQPIVVAVEVTSPAGDNVMMTSAQSITVTPAVTGLTVANAQVRIASRQISTTSELDLSDLDSELADKVDSAYVRLAITNPFPVSGSLQVTLDAPGSTVTRTIQLAPSASGDEQVVRLSGEEIRGFIGEAVTLRIGGAVSAAAPVAVTPTQVVAIVSRLDLFIVLGR